MKFSIIVDIRSCLILYLQIHILPDLSYPTMLFISINIALILLFLKEVKCLLKKYSSVLFILQSHFAENLYKIEHEEIKSFKEEHFVYKNLSF